MTASTYGEEVESPTTSISTGPRSLNKSVRVSAVLPATEMQEVLCDKPASPTRGRAALTRAESSTSFEDCVSAGSDSETSDVDPQARVKPFLPPKSLRRQASASSDNSDATTVFQKTLKNGRPKTAS